RIEWRLSRGGVRRAYHGGAQEGPQVDEVLAEKEPLVGGEGPRRPDADGAAFRLEGDAAREEGADKASEGHSSSPGASSVSRSSRRVGVGPSRSSPAGRSVSPIGLGPGSPFQFCVFCGGLSKTNGFTSYSGLGFCPRFPGGRGAASSGRR